MVLCLCKTIEDAQTKLADKLVRIIEETTGEVRLALGGGRTPEFTYARLRDILFARHSDNSRIRVFVTDDSKTSGSNEQMIRTVFCEPLDITCIAPAEFGELSKHMSVPNPLFHAAVLGLGTDGHTAALFTAADCSNDDRVVCTVSPAGEERLSLGLLVLAQARQIFLLAAGTDKSAAVEKLFYGGGSSGGIVTRWPQTTCIIDEEAGCRLAEIRSPK